MNVTIIGTGKMASALSNRFLAGGHQVSLLGHTQEKAEALEKDLKQTVKGGNNVSVIKNDKIKGDVVILAIPYSATSEVAQKYADELAGKVVVDITNPINYQTMSPLVEGSSSAEELAHALPVSSRVVKAFNSTFSNNLTEGVKGGLPLDVFIAGDDAQAKVMVAKLIEDGGMRPIDTGPLVRARQLEGLGLLHIGMQNLRNTNFMSAIKVID